MQEAYSHKIAVRPERRRQFQKELVSSVHDAFRLLTDLLSQNPTDQLEKVYSKFPSKGN
jgi:transportin-3